MKAIALLIAAASLPVSARAASMFSPAQERRVLEAVQEACNNTWCEGNYGYNFRKFHCEGGKCTLDFDIISYNEYDENGKPNEASADRYELRCDYAPVKELGDVLNFERNYVTAEYFKSLATCIDENASGLGLPKAQPKPSEPNPPMPLPVEAKTQLDSVSGVSTVFRPEVGFQNPNP
jgi:hypothetical protein